MCQARDPFAQAEVAARGSILTFQKLAEDCDLSSCYNALSSLLERQAIGEIVTRIHYVDHTSGDHHDAPTRWTSR